MKWNSFVILFLFLPNITSAAVYISEIAWMGSTESANYEWIELHNDGTDEDVTGWQLTDDMNLTIDLTGTIPGGSHAVLERTSDNSAPGSAFLIYTGAMVNTGATLKLVRSDGSVADQVSGGENWSLVGGDNITKETAQYTSSGWVTSVGTPGKANQVVPESPSATSSEDKTETKTSSGSSVRKSSPGETVKLILPEMILKLDIDSQSVGYVNQAIDFTIKPSGIGNTLIDSLQYEWNFGDGFSSTEKEPTHVYSYPGTYVVTVYAGFKRQEQVARYEITILPVEVSLTTNQVGDVQINNNSPYEIDLSGYILRGDGVFKFPARSIILPGQTITINKNRLGGVAGNFVSISDTEGKLLSSMVPTEMLNKRDVDVVSLTENKSEFFSIGSPAQIVEDSGFGFVDSEQPVTPNTSSDPVDIESGEALAEEGVQMAMVGTQDIPRNSWPYLVFIGVMAVAIVAVYTKSNVTK